MGGWAATCSQPACQLPSPDLPAPPCAAEAAHSATAEDLAGWVAAADHCQLSELRQRCIGELAGGLASAPGSAFADAALVAERCDRGSLGQLLGVLAAAASLNRLSVSPDAMAEALRRPAAEQPAVGEPRGCRGLQWELASFSQQPTAAGVAACSPWMLEGGREWRLEVHPGGDTARASGHVSGERSVLHCSSRSASPPAAAACAGLLPCPVLAASSPLPRPAAQAMGVPGSVEGLALGSRPGRQVAAPAAGAEAARRRGCPDLPRCPLA